MRTLDAADAPFFESLMAPEDKLAINFSWLYALRWTAIVGQIATIALVRFFLDPELYWSGIVGILAATTATNVGLGVWLGGRRRGGWKTWMGMGESALRGIIALDIFSLTGILYLSGGPTNPFTALYLVHVALAATLVDSKSAWFLCGLALIGYGFLFWNYVPVACLECAAHDSVGGIPTIDLHLRGMLVAFGTAAVLIVYFVSRVNRSLAQREAELYRFQQRKNQDEKLDALATLAAGAAHELASPLSTIAVVARELELELGRTPQAGSTLAEIRLVRTEVERCRRILDHMNASAGQSAGEPIVDVAVGDIVQRVLGGLAENAKISTSLESGLSALTCRIPREAVCQAIRAVVQNALDASPPDQEVCIRVGGAEDDVVVTVADAGPGIDEQVLRRVGEPFFTTKEPGKGMGLGIFLARRILERLGGGMTLQNAPDAGVVASIRVPRRVAARSKAVSCDNLPHDHV